VTEEGWRRERQPHRRESHREIDEQRGQHAGQGETERERKTIRSKWEMRKR
jgi:hypothetical protein